MGVAFRTPTQRSVQRRCQQKTYSINFRRFALSSLRSGRYKGGSQPLLFAAEVGGQRRNAAQRGATRRNPAQPGATRRNPAQCGATRRTRARDTACAGPVPLAWQRAPIGECHCLARGARPSSWGRRAGHTSTLHRGRHCRRRDTAAGAARVRAAVCQRGAGPGRRSSRQGRPGIGCDATGAGEAAEAAGPRRPEGAHLFRSGS